jgi:DNA primase
MDDRFLNDLKNRIDLVEVVRKYAELKKVGRNFMCRSPFRNERTPSFSISPEKQFWYDFGTSNGGDAISFIEKIENVSFPEAVEILAQSAGMDVPKTFGGEKISKTEKNDIFQLHEKAAEYFSLQLKESTEAQTYLESRDFSKEIIKKWKIGFGGDKPDGCVEFLRENGFSLEAIQKSGVAFERQFGNKAMRDRFVGRIILPIREPKNGEIAAFSGRIFRGEEKVAKYVNSPENPVYHKSSTLLGLDLARKIIPKKDFVILVEGNFDVVAAHDIGFENTAATCGTALTENHLRILKRLTKNIYCAFDNDLAGKKATLRSVEMILKAEMVPKIVEIPAGKDFDDARRDSVEGLKKAVNEAKSALEYLCEKFFAKNVNGTIEGETKFLDSFFYFLKFSSRPVEVDEFLNRIAKKLSRPKGVIEAEFQKFRKSTKSIKPKFITETKKEPFSQEESFAGFVCAFWKVLGEKITDEILELFVDDQVRNFLIAKKEGRKSEDNMKILGAEMEERSRERYSDSSSQEVFIEDFDKSVQNLKDKKEKLRVKNFAKNLKF